MAKTKKIEITIEKCRDCIWVTNSARRHNDSFTSQPCHLTWFCINPNNKGFDVDFIIHNEEIIDDKCPLE